MQESSGDHHGAENSSGLQKLLDKMIKDIEEVKANTTSEKNTTTLDKVEKAIDKLSGMLESFTFSAHTPEDKHEDVTPETPVIEVPGAMKFIHVRKPGGRIVKRQVKESVTKE